MARIEQDIAREADAALGVPQTPAYVYSESLLRDAARAAAAVADYAGCRLLYTLKSCALLGVIETLAPRVSGFAASSPFEMRLARGAMSSRQTLHCYSPAIPALEMATVAENADFLSLNSVSQLEAAMKISERRASLGLRVNPHLSFVSDSRYDPCRRRSKLGAPLSHVAALPAAVVERVEGAHVHANCESWDLGELAATADVLADALSAFDSLRWLNLGGGYYFGDEVDPAPLASAVRRLSARFGAEVFIEPGTALVQRAGFLVAEVLDSFSCDGALVSVLDATTSHLPEAFEYGYAPRLRGAERGGSRLTSLAGRSCLAGDVFGEYRLRNPLRRGQRVALLDAGAYSHARATAFNGIPIPAAYLLRESGEFELMSEYGYGEFAARNGGS